MTQLAQWLMDAINGRLTREIPQAQEQSSPTGVGPQVVDFEGVGGPPALSQQDAVRQLIDSSKNNSDPRYQESLARALFSATNQTVRPAQEEAELTGVQQASLRAKNRQERELKLDAAKDDRRRLQDFLDSPEGRGLGQQEREQLLAQYSATYSSFGDVPPPQILQSVYEDEDNPELKRAKVVDQLRTNPYYDDGDEHRIVFDDKGNADYAQFDKKVTQKLDAQRELRQQEIQLRQTKNDEWKYQSDVIRKKYDMDATPSPAADPAEKKALADQQNKGLSELNRLRQTLYGDNGTTAPKPKDPLGSEKPVISIPDAQAFPSMFASGELKAGDIVTDDGVRRLRVLPNGKLQKLSQ